MTPGGSPTASPLASRRTCGYFAQRESHTGVRASEMALPGPAGADPQPSSITKAARRGSPAWGLYRRHGATKRTIRAKESTLRLAPPTSTPSMSGSSHQLVDVVRPHTAAVEDPDRLRGVDAGALRELPPDEPDRLLGDLGSGRLTGADGPDGLVRYGHPAGVLRLQPGPSRQRAAATAPPRSCLGRARPRSRPHT